MKFENFKAAQWKDFSIIIMIPLYKERLNGSDRKLFQLMFAINWLIYGFEKLPVSFIERLEMIDLLEDTYPQCKIKPKMHSVRHLGWYYRKVGDIKKCDAFSMENLLSFIKESIHSSHKPHIQTIRQLIAHSMINGLNDFLKLINEEAFHLGDKVLSEVFEICSITREHKRNLKVCIY